MDEKIMSNEDALNAFADMLEPMSEIITDEELKKAIAEKKSKLIIAQIAIKRHTKAFIKILALSEGIPVEEYRCNMFTLPIKLINILNKEEFEGLF